jgi:hypothetical protein
MPIGDLGLIRRGGAQRFFREQLLKRSLIEGIVAFHLPFARTTHKLSAERADIGRQLLLGRDYDCRQAV